MRALLLWAAYQAFWFACIIGVHRGLVWPAIGALALFLPLRYACSPRAHWSGDTLRIAAVAVLGFGVDSVLASTHLIVYAMPWPSQELAPWWIVAIWVAFGLSLREGLKFLHGRPLLAAVLGAIAAPLSYIGAAHGFGVIHFPHGQWPAMATLATLWLLALPLALWLMGLMPSMKQRTSGAMRSAHHGL